MEFRKLFVSLPEQVQEQTPAAYRQLKEDPSYPSLRFKKVHPELPIYSAWISRNYRAVGQWMETQQFGFGLVPRRLRQVVRADVIARHNNSNAADRPKCFLLRFKFSATADLHR